MRSKSGFFALLLLPLLSGSAPMPARAQETYRIVVKDAVGDAVQIANEYEMSMSLTASAGDKDQKIDLHNTEQQRYREDVIGLDAVSHANRVKRTYTVSRKSEKGEEGDKAQKTSLQGKTIRLERKGDKTLISTDNGVISDEDKEALQNDLDGHYSLLFPDRPLAIGEEWTPDSKALLHTFKGAEKLGVHCKLIEVVASEGRKSAHFHINLDVILSTPVSGVKMEMKLEGDGYQALDIQRPLSLTFDGPVTASGEETHDGTVVKYVGKGTIHMKMSADWQKVAGKSVGKSDTK